MKHQKKRRKNQEQKSFSKSITLILLVSILIVAFSLRWYGINLPHISTFDESLYQELGYQLYKDPGDYSPRPTYLKLQEMGRHSPDYLNQPLFKHPPLFSYLIALSIFIVGISVQASYLVPVLFGSLTIWLVFLSGRDCFDRKTGIVAAILLCVDPIHWLCSEKIWMGSSQTFFLLLTLYLFLKGLSKDKLFLWAGISLGLALLTKYTSLLMMPIFFAFALTSRRELFRNKYFWSLWGAALAVFSPWLIWYYRVYGGFSLTKSTGVRNIVITQAFRNLQYSMIWMIPALILLLISGWLVRYFSQAKNRNKFISALKRNKNFRVILWISVVPVAIIFIGILLRFHPFLKQIFSPSHIPEVGWKRGLFSAEPIWFYFRRLPQFSPFYLIAFLGLIKIASTNTKERLLSLYCLFILIFHSWWGNYQSRYIITAIPILLLLCAALISKGWEWIGRLPAGKKKLWGYMVYGGVILYFAAKTIIVAINVSLPNTGCYF